MKKVTYWTSVIIIGAVLGLALQFAKAWTEPTEAPPGGNIGAPINTSGTNQVKVGIITAGSFTTDGSVISGPSGFLNYEKNSSGTPILIGGIAKSGTLKGNAESDVTFFANNGRALTFFSNGNATERMKIDTAGNVTVANKFIASGSITLGDVEKEAWPITQCKNFYAPFTYQSSSIACPAEYPVAASGGCDSNCAFLNRSYIEGDTQVCGVVIATASLCSGPGQKEVRAVVRCCK